MSVMNDKEQETKYILLKKELQGSQKWRISQTIFKTYHWQGLQLPFFQSAFKDMGVEEISRILEPRTLPLQGTFVLHPDQTPLPVLRLGGCFRTMLL